MTRPDSGPITNSRPYKMAAAEALAGLRLYEPRYIPVGETEPRPAPVRRNSRAHGKARRRKGGK